MGVTKKTTAQKLEKHRVDEMNGAVISESLTKTRQEKLADGDQRVPLFSAVRRIHPISRRRLPLQRPKGVSGRGMRVLPFFCV